MPSKAKKRTAARKSASAPRKKSQVKPKPAAASEAATNRFVNDLLTRGEAAKLDPDGNLPLEATHVITKEGDNETPSVRRLRYKLW